MKRYLIEKNLMISEAKIRGNISGIPPAKIIPTMIAMKQLA
jgi:hypothetical protein